MRCPSASVRDVAQCGADSPQWCSEAPAPTSDVDAVPRNLATPRHDVLPRSGKLARFVRLRPLEIPDLDIVRPLSHNDDPLAEQRGRASGITGAELQDLECSAPVGTKPPLAVQHEWPTRVP